MSVSRWTRAGQLTDDAVDIRPPVAIPPGGPVGAAGRRRRGGGVAARERFSSVSRPVLRLVPPLPADADWPTDAVATSWAPRLCFASGASSQDVAGEPVTAAADHRGAARFSIESVSSPGQARSASAPVRLTRRGRLVLAGLLVVFPAAIVGVLASRVEAAAPSSPPRAVVVHAGDTLWSIAARVHPRGSLTDTMLTIERLNHMPDGTVYVGQQLFVPNS